MKKITAIFITVLFIAVGCFGCKKPVKEVGYEKNHLLDVADTKWNATDEHGIEKVSETPTFQLEKNVSEGGTGLKPFCFFSDGMVLQRNAVTRIFGEADYTGGVAVEIDGKVYYGSADNGRFDVYLPPVSKGEGLTLTIYGIGNKVTVKDVCYGEVILFSGQSNMNWRLCDTVLSTSPAPTPGKQYLPFYGVLDTPYVPNETDDPETYKEYVYNKTLSETYVNKTEEMIVEDDGVRMMLVDSGHDAYSIGRNKTERSGYDMEKKWIKAVKRNSILYCSMFAYYFARNLREFTGVPVGIICASVGATSTSAWAPRDVYESNKKYFPDTGEDESDFNSVSSCYNTLIAPMKNYKTGAFVWYQGEVECASLTYCDAFAALAEGYRQKFDDPAMKILVVSLPRYGLGAEYPKGFSQADYGKADREFAMENAYSARGRANQRLLPSVIHDCAVSVSINTGDFDDIHPSDKTVISRQAVCRYLTELYGFKEERLLFPTLNGICETSDGIVLRFENCGEGLLLKNNGRGFQISENGVDFVQIKGVFSDGGVALSAADAGLERITRVRYGWLEYPRISRTEADKYVSVFNSFGMPLDQFDVKVRDYSG
ncbi:MAG: hypothetical protein IJU84_00470 [Clostridia bacterium]|nr:hypothetical protein [Clostridia bacterium]